MFLPYLGIMRDTLLGLKPRGFSGLLPSDFPGVRRTTWLGARILGRMIPVDSVWHATTRSQSTTKANAADNVRHTRFTPSSPLRGRAGALHVRTGRPDNYQHKHRAIMSALFF